MLRRTPNVVFPFLMAIMAVLAPLQAGSAPRADRPSDAQMAELFTQIGEDLPAVVQRAEQLTRVLQGEEKSTWARQEEAMTELQKRVRRMAQEIPASLQEGRYVQVPLDNVYAQQVVAILESLEMVSDEAARIFAGHRDLKTLSEDLEYRQKMFVIYDFSHDLDRLVS